MVVVVYYSFSLLLLLLLGEAHGLYVREALPRVQATPSSLHQAQCVETTENLAWRMEPDPANPNDDVVLEIPITVTRSCRNPEEHRALRKRQRQPNGRNVFNSVCQREITGRRMTTTRTVDVYVRINPAEVVSVPTPDGGRVSVWAYQNETFYDPSLPPSEWERREELEVTVINRSGCPVWVEWLTRLYVNPRMRAGPAELVQPRALEPTSRDDWDHDPSACDLTNLMPLQGAIVVGVRLLITAFGNACHR